MSLSSKEEGERRRSQEINQRAPTALVARGWDASPQFDTAIRTHAPGQPSRAANGRVAACRTHDRPVRDGQSMNAFAMGPLVDISVVVLESIHRRSHGRGRVTAALADANASRSRPSRRRWRRSWCSFWSCSSPASRRSCSCRSRSPSRPDRRLRGLDARHARRVPVLPPEAPSRARGGGRRRVTGTELDLVTTPHPRWTIARTSSRRRASTALSRTAQLLRCAW